MLSVVVIVDVGRPVVNTRRTVHGIARIVHVKRCLRGGFHGHRRGFELKPLRRILGAPVFVPEKITGVVQHNVLHQVHAFAVQSI